VVLGRIPGYESGWVCYLAGAFCPLSAPGPSSLSFFSIAPTLTFIVLDSGVSFLLIPSFGGSVAIYRVAAHSRENAFPPLIILDRTGPSSARRVSGWFSNRPRGLVFASVGKRCSFLLPELRTHFFPPVIRLIPFEIVQPT